MISRKGKKVAAILVLLLTLIMCVGTLLEGVAVFADTDGNAEKSGKDVATQDVTGSNSGSADLDGEKNTDSKFSDDADSVANQNQPSNQEAVTSSDVSVSEIEIAGLTFKVTNTKLNYVNVSGKKVVTVLATLDSASGYTASKYNVIDETTGEFVLKDIVFGTKGKVTVTDGHVYRIQAEATDATGKAVTVYSKDSYSVDFPKAATGVKATCAKNDNLIKVTWNKSTDADRYAVYRSTSTTRPATPLKYVVGTSFSERHKGGSYYYWVQPMNKNDFTAAGTYTRSGKVTAGNYLAIPVRNYYFTATAKKRIPIYKSAKSTKVVGYLPKGKTVVIKKKSPKVVAQYGKVKRVYFDDKTLKKKGWVKYSSIKLKNHVAGKSNDWSRSVKENYVNGKKYNSSTNYLIWLSKYTQKVYVFKRANRNSKWVLKKTYRCSTGTFAHPTPTSTKYIIIRKQYDRHRVTNKGMRYYYKYLSAFGKKGSSGKGNAFHTICWKEGSNKRLKPVKDKPDTKGCARMFTGEAKWIYNHVPNKTRVISY